MRCHSGNQPPSFRTRSATLAVRTGRTSTLSCSTATSTECAAAWDPNKRFVTPCCCCRLACDGTTKLPRAQRERSRALLSQPQASSQAHARAPVPTGRHRRQWRPQQACRESYPIVGDDTYGSDAPRGMTLVGRTLFITDSGYIKTFDVDSHAPSPGRRLACEPRMDRQIVL